MSMSSTDYALLSQDAYQDRKKDQTITLGGVEYKVLDHADDPVTGYQGTAYRRVGTNDIIIAHRGTEQIFRDGVLADAGMVLTGINIQTPDAMTFTKKVMEEAKRESAKSDAPIDITVTGHSLGGTLAEITAYRYGLHGETFNAYGAADLLEGIPPGGYQVIDHVRATDAVSAGSTHFGEVRIYAAAQDIDRLSRVGYRDDSGLLSPRNPLEAVDLSAHGIDNFVPDSKTLGHSIISAENQARYRAHHVMVDRYRSDVQDLRTGLSAGWELPKLLGEASYATGHAAAETLVHGVHATEHAATQAGHAIEHAGQYVEHTAQHVARAVGDDISQGAHAAEHAAHTVAQDATHAFDTLRHPGSWFDSKPKPSIPPAVPARLDDPAHPDHALYEQARTAVHKLDAGIGRTPDKQSDQLAAALVVAAKREGLTAINEVHLSDDGTRAFAVQGRLDSPLRQFAQVQTAEAVNTPIDKSSAATQAVVKPPEPVMPPPTPTPTHSQGFSR